MTTHGFRTVGSTLLNEQGFTADAVERQLAHDDGDKVRAAYNAAEYLPERRAMLQWYADHLLPQAVGGAAGRGGDLTLLRLAI